MGELPFAETDKKSARSGQQQVDMEEELDDIAPAVSIVLNHRRSTA